MTHNKNKLVALIFLFLCPLVSFSGDLKPLKEGEIYNPVPAIMHHIAHSGASRGIKKITSS